MKLRLKPGPTFIGSFAVVIWGLSLPLNRLIASEIGVPALIGTVFTVIGILGLLNRLRLGQGFPDAVIFRNPLLYLRWLFFSLNPVGVWTAACIVQKQHLPMVVLINYLWPTGIILFSVLIAGVKITRRGFFIVGTMIVIAALTVETLEPGMLTSDLFANPTDRIAYALSFLSAFSWAFYTALTRRSGDKTGGAAMMPYFQLTLGLALPVSFLPGVYAWDHLTIVTAVVLASWCLLQFVAFLSWDFGTRNGNVVILSLCADFIPWLSLAVSHILLGVVIPQRTMLAALLLVAGAMITRYGTLKKRGDKAQLEQLAHEHSPAD